MSELAKKVSDQVARSEGREPSHTQTAAEMLRDPERLKEIAKALPNGWDAERFARIALTTINSSPKLQQCEASSVVGAVLLAAQLNLELSGPLGHAYLVPFKNKASFLLGYKGMIELARRSGQILSIEAREVRENDEFKVDYGLNSALVHVPFLSGDRGEAIAWYGIARFVNGGHYFQVLTKDEVEKHRGQSSFPNSPAWKDSYGAMASKTVIRVMAPFLPLTPMVEKAIAQDESVHSVIDSDIIDLPSEELYEDQ